MSYSNIRKPKTEKILKKSRGGKKHLTYRGTRIRITVDFMSEAMQNKKIVM